MGRRFRKVIVILRGGGHSSYKYGISVAARDIKYKAVIMNKAVRPPRSFCDGGRCDGQAWDLSATGEGRRADKALVDAGIAESRSQARQMILDGKIYILERGVEDRTKYFFGHFIMTPSFMVRQTHLLRRENSPVLKPLLSSASASQPTLVHMASPPPFAAPSSLPPELPRAESPSFNEPPEMPSVDAEDGTSDDVSIGACSTECLIAIVCLIAVVTLVVYPTIFVVLVPGLSDKKKIYLATATSTPALVAASGKGAKAAAVLGIKAAKAAAVAVAATSTTAVVATYGKGTAASKSSTPGSAAGSSSSSSTAGPSSSGTAAGMGIVRLDGTSPPEGEGQKAKRAKLPGKHKDVEMRCSICDEVKITRAHEATATDRAVLALLIGFIPPGLDSKDILFCRLCADQFKADNAESGKSLLAESGRLLIVSPELDGDIAMDIGTELQNALPVLIRSLARNFMAYGSKALIPFATRLHGCSGGVSSVWAFSPVPVGDSLCVISAPDGYPEGVATLVRCNPESRTLTVRSNGTEFNVGIADIYRPSLEAEVQAAARSGDDTLRRELAALRRAKEKEAAAHAADLEACNREHELRISSLEEDFKAKMDLSENGHLLLEIEAQKATINALRVKMHRDKRSDLKDGAAEPQRLRHSIPTRHAGERSEEATAAEEATSNRVAAMKVATAIGETCAAWEGLIDLPPVELLHRHDIAQPVAVSGESYVLQLTLLEVLKTVDRNVVMSILEEFMPYAFYAYHIGSRR